MINFTFDRNKLDSKILNQFKNKDVDSYFEDETDEFILTFLETEKRVDYQFSLTYQPDYKKVYDDKDIRVYWGNDEVNLSLCNKRYNPVTRSLYDSIQEVIENTTIENYELQKDAKAIEETNEYLRTQ